MKIKNKEKASNKVQGINPTTKSLSDVGVQIATAPAPRGLGSEYANAVNTLVEGSNDIKGSTHGFLGIDKKTLDPKEHAHSLVKKK
jgi:hypothetical protein